MDNNIPPTACQTGFEGECETGDRVCDPVDGLVCVPRRVPDADDDTRISVDCGGDDCDDNNPDVAPDRPEVCDPNGVDEDCNPDTVFDLEESVGHCGACDRRCVNPGGTTRCEARECVPSCAPGAADPDDNPDNGCESGFRYVGVANAATWADAQRRCSRMGMNLPRADTEAGIELITSLNVVDPWTDLTDRATEGTFAHLDGSPPQAVFWGAQLPDNSEVADCVFLTRAGVWQNLTCAALKGVACEGPTVATPFLVASGLTEAEVYVNGELLGTRADWSTPIVWYPGPLQSPTVIAIRVRRSSDLAGLAAHLELEPEHAVGTDVDWRVMVAQAANGERRDPPAGWHQPNFDPQGWQAATVLGELGMPGRESVATAFPPLSPARWIWSSLSSDVEVYFRGVVYPTPP